MKILKIILYIIFGVFSFIILSTFYLYNAILLGLIFLLIFVIETKKLNRNKKIILLLIILVSTGIYILYPKKITGCGYLPERACSSCNCVGIPMQGIGTPICIGKANSCPDIFDFNKTRF